MIIIYILMTPRLCRKLGEREVELRAEATEEDMELALEELQTLRNEQEPQLRAVEQEKLRLEQSLAVRLSL
jgi:hypothetical protein